MKVLFAGTPQLAVAALDALAAEHEVVGVLTAPDTRKGRGKKLVYNPVKQRALELGLRVLQPQRLRTEARKEIAPLGAELLAVYAYGKIFGPRFLQLFPMGAINVHPSLLPRYRGSIPLIAPLVNGDSQTGICVQKMALELDSGDILSERRLPLSGEETAADLSDWASREGAQLLRETVTAIEQGRANAVPQQEEAAVYCRKLNKTDGKINWRLPAAMIARSVRGYNPWPKAYTFWQEKRLNILSAAPVQGDNGSAGYGSTESESTDGHTPEEAGGATQKAAPGTVIGMDRELGILVQTGSGLLALRQLQLQSKKPAEWKDFLNGNQDIIGSRLGEQT